MTAIIDAHHHVWRRKDLPWLIGPMLPRIFGPYEAIKRDYPMSEYVAEVADWGVVKSVYVQANWAPNWFEDEVAWVSRVAAETGWPTASWVTPISPNLTCARSSIGCASTR